MITEQEKQQLIAEILVKLRRREIYVAHADLHALGGADQVPPAVGKIEVQDEGTTVGTRPKINFTGAGVTAADDAANNRVNINIPGGGAGGGYNQVQENGTNLTQRSTLNFASGVIASDDTTNLRTDVNIDYGGTPPNVDLGAGSAGSSTQVSRADHKHSAPTGTPSGLGNINSAGASNAIPRLDHVHKRDVRVASGGVDVGTRNRLNFSGLTVTDDAANDEVDVIHDSAGHVTGGDSHDHAGGDGAQIQHGNLAGVGPHDHHPAMLVGSFGSRPTTAPVGTQYTATDTQQLFVFV